MSKGSLQPLIFDPTQPADQVQLDQYMNRSKVLDVYEVQRAELTKTTRQQSSESAVRWVYFPWNHMLVKILSATDYQALLASRNAVLISESDQRELRTKTIGIVGLSVGSNVARALALTGVGRRFKLADPDDISLSNLNRVQADLTHLGRNKVEVAAQSLWQQNPYLVIDQFTDGLGPLQLAAFFQGDAPLDVIIDECDDLQLKLYLRLLARSLRIPLVMVTDNAYTVTCEVNRFDLDHNCGDFKNFPDFSFADICSAYSQTEPLSLSVDQEDAFIRSLIGEEHMQPEMEIAAQQRLRGELDFWPQLGMTAFVSGGLAAFLVKSIFTDTTVPLFKHSFSLQSFLAMRDAADRP